jgi:uncharacterized coiled-coil protein SlyX
MSDDMTGAIEELVEQATRAETIARENRNEMVKLNAVLTELTRRIEKTEEKLGVGRDSIELLQDRIDGLTRSGAEQLTTLEKVQRAIAEMESRFAGKTLTGMSEQPSYESVVSLLIALRTRLSGGEGQLSYEAVRRSIEDSRFLGTVVKGLIGLFGVGAVLAAGQALFGRVDAPPAVIQLQGEVKRIDGRVDGVESDLKREERERLKRVEEALLKR